MDEHPPADGVAPEHAPAGVAATRELLRAAAADGRRLLPCGRRSRLARHFPSARPDGWLSMRRLDGLLWLDPEDQTCEVEAGMTPAALDALAAEHGLMLGVDAPGRERGTLGGVFLAPDHNLRGALWGPPRDHVLGARWLLADGSEIRTGARVVKSVAGYDLTRLLVGSRGRLACCVALTLRLVPRPRRPRCFRLERPVAPTAAALPEPPTWMVRPPRGDVFVATDGTDPRPRLDVAGEEVDPVAGEAALEAVRTAFAEAPLRVALTRPPAVWPEGCALDLAGRVVAADTAVAARLVADDPEAVVVPHSRPSPWLAPLARALVPSGARFHGIS